MFRTTTLARATIHEMKQGDKPNALILADSASKEDVSAVEAKKFDPAKDLMKMVSVLVSTGKNRNDDVFVRDELSKVRASGKDKPLNIEHNSDHIIGHMTATYATKKDGTVIAEDVKEKDLPEDFDITNEAVIYAFVKPKVAEAIRKTAAAGDLFVSVEMWFTDYDFLVGSKIVRRNQATAFLEGTLRTNGGDGTYKGESVGRVLRNMLIGGIGVVEKPANPESVIKSISSLRADGARDVEVYKESAIANNVVGDLGSEIKAGEKLTEDAQMKELFKEMAEEVKATVAQGLKDAASNSAKSASASDKAPEVKATEAPKTEAAPAAQAPAAVAPASNDKAIEELRSALTAALQRIDALEKQSKQLLASLKEAEDLKVLSSRRETLATCGLKTEDVERRMAKCASMTKEDFDQYVSDLKELFNTYLRGEAADKTANDKSAKGGEAKTEASQTQDAKDEDTADDTAEETITVADDGDEVIDVSKLEAETDIPGSDEAVEATVEQRMEEAVVSKLAARNAAWRKLTSSKK